ncbi:DNA polymerase [Lysinibacillus xylanilyticus]|uniref:DNA polymerase n=1 Tax=Lysinibacillus xylanilyticus TaxID=582475 RepID=UPI003D0762D9
MRKLREVKRAMDAGLIGREAPKCDKFGKPKALGKFSKAEAIRLYAVLAGQQRESKIEELVTNTPSNYVLVTDEQSLRQVVADALKEPIIAVDTETTGLDVYVDVIVGVSLTLPTQDKHYYIPFEPTQDERALPPEMVGELKALMESQEVAKVLHNALYDIAMFERHGIKLNNVVWDTMSAMHVLNENEASYALKNLATTYLNEPSDTFSELFGRDAKFAEVPLDVALVYAAKDTDLTWRMYQFQLTHLSKMPTVLDYYRRVEVPLMYAVYDMERTGFEIDVEYAAEYGAEMKVEIDSLEKELTTELNVENINSNQQLKPALEAIIGEKLPNLDAKRTLKPLKKKHAIIAKLLRYRELAKLYSTYISVLPEKIHPVTGRLHARFNPNGARTGRFSSGGNGVNLQNQPHAARRLFKAPDGCVIIGGDFSQQEVRCAAYFTNEPVLKIAYAEGKDVYSSLASEFYGKPYEDCGDGTPERKAMKVVVLAVMYGMGPGALADMLDISMDEAKRFMADFFAKMPRIQSWINETQAFTKKHGYVWMDGEQRKRRLPEAKRKTRGYDPEVSRALRQGPNAQIQGTSAIQGKVTLINLHEFCKRKGWQLFCVVHDETLVLAPEDFTREDLAEFERIMLESYTFGDVKNKTDIEIARIWGEGMTPSEWFAKQKEETE